MFLVDVAVVGSSPSGIEKSGFFFCLRTSASRTWIGEGEGLLLLLYWLFPGGVDAFSPFFSRRGM